MLKSRLLFKKKVNSTVNYSKIINSWNMKLPGRFWNKKAIIYQCFFNLHDCTFKPEFYWSFQGLYGLDSYKHKALVLSGGIERYQWYEMNWSHLLIHLYFFFCSLNSSVFSTRKSLREFFLYIHSSVLLENKKLLWSLFSSAKSTTGHWSNMHKNATHCL